MPDPGDREAGLGLAVARASSRRGFLARVGAALVAGAGGSKLARPEPAEAYYNFCGHTYTTANCPHPTGLPRIDARGRPLRASDGHPVDDLGRPINPAGHPIDADGNVLVDPNGRPIPPAPRSRVCLDGVPDRYNIRTYVDGSWYRCCGGNVRRLVDCCAFSAHRINGDASLPGYCFSGRTVFCVTYYDTGVKC